MPVADVCDVGVEEERGGHAAQNTDGQDEVPEPWDEPVPWETVAVHLKGIIP